MNLDNPKNLPYVFTIPATIDRAVTPNGMPNTANGLKKRHRLEQELKRTTMWAMKAMGPYLVPDAPWQLDYVVAWGKSRKRMDDDNLKASMKYVQDGIADVAGIDDKHMEVGRIKQIRDPQAVGYIQVTIRTMEEVEVAS